MQSGRPYRSGRRPRLAPVLGCLLVVGAIGAAGTLTGCSGDPAPAAASAPHRGGTLELLLEAAGFSHLDPQRTYTAPALNVTRLIYRTLTTFQASPEHPSGILTPDLATDLGRPSNGDRTWEFTLKPELRWEDGQPVTCAQVKYGVERSFASQLTGGPSYPRDYLAGAAGYQGPYVGDNNGGPGLAAVTCPDQRTIQFQLNRPVTDFGYTVAMPVFAPVRPDRDTRDQYDARPFSNGPYKIGSADGRQLTLVRNRYWNPRTDPARPAYPDRVVVRFGVDPVRSTNDLITDTAADRAAVPLDYGVPPNFVQQVVNDGALAARTAAGTTGAVRYLAINTHGVPDLRCRQALEYALDRQAYRTVLGGSFFGDYASTMIPPGMPSYQRFDLYGGIRRPTGDPDRARSLLAAGDCPTKLTMDYQDTPSYQRAAQTIVDSYQRVGVQVVLNPIPKAQFYNVVGVPASQHNLVLAAWVPDWPNGSAVLPALYDGRLLAAHAAGGNYNFSQLDDPTVNAAIDRARAEADLGRQYKLWGAADRAGLAQAAVVPILYEKTLVLSGRNVRGGFLQSLYGEPDVASLGLA